jgi:tripartite-type tricarboxylate transporter receptor subunit TctC
VKLPGRQFLQLAAGTAAMPAVWRIARAQVYPTRPITMVVTFPAGAANDAVGRVLAERMRGSLGQTIIIENVTGADGSIGTGRAARAKPDGYTIVLGGVDTHVINGALYSLQYDVLKDFAPILPLIRTSPILMGRKTMPGGGVPELIGWLRANPNKASVQNARSSSRCHQKNTSETPVLQRYAEIVPSVNRTAVISDPFEIYGCYQTGHSCEINLFSWFRVQNKSYQLR